MDSEKLIDENETDVFQDTKVAELERLLADFLIFSNDDNSGTSNQNLIEFSDKEIESEDENESDDDVAGFFPHDSITDNVKATDELSSFLEENSHSKAFDDSDPSVIQKSIPLQIRNKEGFLMCSLCRWIAPNESTESFLAHCRTSLHRMKLKDRFPSEQTKKQPPKDDSRPKTIPKKLSPVNFKKRQNKVKNTQKDQKKEGPPAKAAKAAASTENKKETEAVKNLKIHALAKGLTSILPFSKKEFICTICNKKIPKASDLDVLMKNVSNHLQSKTHLKKLSEIKNSFTSSCEANCKKYQKPNNPTNQGKKVKNNNESKALPAEAPQNVTKVKIPVAGKNLEKGKPVENKKKSATGSNGSFLCLPCNLMCENIEVFNVHLGLKSHSNSLVGKNMKADMSLTNMGKCKGCQAYLYGSLFLIDKHHSKCVKK